MARKKKSSKDLEAETDQTSVNDTDETSIEDMAEHSPNEDEKPTDQTNAGSSESLEEVDTQEYPDETQNPEEDESAAEKLDDRPEALLTDDAVVKAENIEQVNIGDRVTAPVAEPVVVRQGGFIPMVLGGIMAAVIGFAVARYVLPETGSDAVLLTEIQRKLDQQSDVVSKMNERIDTLESGNDLSNLEASQSDNLAAISGLSDRLSEIETRLDEIESVPAGEGISDAALAAYERQLKDLRSEVDAVTENAALLEENAQNAAKATLRRAAFTRIQTALDAGVAFGAAVTDLEGMGISIPSVLQEAAPNGVASLADLQESFPDAARIALAASRDATDGAEDGGLTSFLRSQLGARSLQPREGSDPDAILSRAEAAAREGRLTDALAEIESLPEEGRAELSGWSDLVARRLEVVAAAQKLGESLN
ncbi:hypothetical protein [uncultured Roseovarius sp.]|uniref:COG4223 family protein n=1 Tax=uncultured Roseovarius sp. TaxID=293344 RepID=UPI00262280F9|nr:hypothetical protein [uncultured Roseovarius sp.]